MLLGREVEKRVIGKNVTEVFVSDEYLVLNTTDEPIWFVVEGDCCSYSYFNDIVGADKLINNGPIKELNRIELGEEFYSGIKEDRYTETLVYGYEFVTEHPVFGDMTTVVAFRNVSNGYYGGWMQFTSYVPEEGMVKVTENWTNPGY